MTDNQYRDNICLISRELVLVVLHVFLDCWKNLHCRNYWTLPFWKISVLTKASGKKVMWSENYLTVYFPYLNVYYIINKIALNIYTIVKDSNWWFNLWTFYHPCITCKQPCHYLHLKKCPLQKYLLNSNTKSFSILWPAVIYEWSIEFIFIKFSSRKILSTNHDSWSKTKLCSSITDRLKSSDVTNFYLSNSFIFCRMKA